MPRMTVVFGSKNGSTAEVAGWIAECLREHDPHVELAQGRSALVKDRSARPDLVVIGGARSTRDVGTVTPIGSFGGIAPS